jgi:hypothetical protein
MALVSLHFPSLFHDSTSRWAQQTEEIQHLIMEQPISSMLAGDTGVQGVGTTIRACRVMANGNHVHPTDGRFHRG